MIRGKYHSQSHNNEALKDVDNVSSDYVLQKKARRNGNKSSADSNLQEVYFIQSSKNSLSKVVSEDTDISSASNNLSSESNAETLTTSNDCIDVDVLDPINQDISNTSSSDHMRVTTDIFSPHKINVDVVRSKFRNIFQQDKFRGWLSDASDDVVILEEDDLPSCSEATGTKHNSINKLDSARGCRSFSDVDSGTLHKSVGQSKNSTSKRHVGHHFNKELVICLSPLRNLTRHNVIYVDDTSNEMSCLQKQKQEAGNTKELNKRGKSQISSDAFESVLSEDYIPLISKSNLLNEDYNLLNPRSVVLDNDAGVHHGSDHYKRWLVSMQQSYK